MRLETVVLGVGLVSLVLGATAQKAAPDQPKGIAAALFAKAADDDYVGAETCAGCHAEHVAEFKNSGHAAYSNDPHAPLNKRSCEGCHGPGKFHLDENHPENVAYTKLSAKEANAACMRCHAETMSQSQWHRTSHQQANLACVSCHQIHTNTPPDEKLAKSKLATVTNPLFEAKPATKKLLKADEMTLCSSCHRAEAAQFRLNSHHPLPEGRVSCSDCHATHPTNKARKTVDIVKEKCASCHAEHAGPFVFEHDPVAGLTGDGCAECHRSHGSHNPKLLKSFSRGLCASCHTEKTTTHYPGRTCWSAGCHVALHGSNNDSRFLRP